MDIDGREDECNRCGENDNEGWGGLHSLPPLPDSFAHYSSPFAKRFSEPSRLIAATQSAANVSSKMTIDPLPEPFMDNLPTCLCLPMESNHILAHKPELCLIRKRIADLFDLLSRSPFDIASTAR